MKRIDDRVADYTLRPLSHSWPLICSAEGSHYITADGRRLIDFNSGQMCASLGHAHPAVMEVLRRVGPDLPLHIASRCAHGEVSGLAVDLADCMEPYTACLVLTTGSEVVEAALALARSITGRADVVCLSQGYHGRTAGARSVSRAHSRAGAGVLVPGSHTLPAPDCLRCPLGLNRKNCDLACLYRCYETLVSGMDGPPAAFILEPILSTGGMITVPENYLRALTELAGRSGALVIADEAQTGAGRCGRMLASEVVPGAVDVVLLSKSLGAGYPVSALLTKREIRDQARQQGFFYSSSHAHDPLACAVARAVIREIRGEKLDERARLLGDHIKRRLLEIKQELNCVGAIRGQGLLQGLELVDDEGDVCADLAWKTAAMTEERLVFNIVGKSVIRIAPPLTIAEGDLDEGLDVLVDAVVQAWRGR